MCLHWLKLIADTPWRNFMYIEVRWYPSFMHWWLEEEAQQRNVQPISKNLYLLGLAFLLSMHVWVLFLRLLTGERASDVCALTLYQPLFLSYHCILLRPDDDVRDGGAAGSLAARGQQDAHIAALQGQESLGRACVDYHGWYGSILIISQNR